MLRAYDKATDACCGSTSSQANPEGIPAVYEVRGRQYVAFAAGASWGTGGDPVWKKAFHRKAGKIDAQGYHVFALPRDVDEVASDLSRASAERREASGIVDRDSERVVTMRTAVFDGSCMARRSAPALPASAGRRRRRSRAGSRRSRRAPDALERVTWRTRTLVGDDRLTSGSSALPAGRWCSHFLEAVVRADAAVVNFVEGSSAQTVEPADPEAARLQPDGRRDRDDPRAHGHGRMLTIASTRLAATPAAQRKLFEFAKAMGVDTIVVPSQRARVGSARHARRQEFGVNVACSATRDTGRRREGLEGRSKRLGVGIDTGAWAEKGLAPREALAAVEGPAALREAARPRRPRASSRTSCSARDGAAERVLQRAEPPEDPAAGADARHDRSGQRAGRPVRRGRRVRSRRAAGLRRLLHRVLAVAPIRWDLVTPGSGETLAPDRSRERAKRVRQKIEAAHSDAGRTRRRRRRASCSSSRACTACRTTRFRTPTSCSSSSAR